MAGEIDTSKAGLEFLFKLRDYAGDNGEFIIYENGEGEFLKDFEDDPNHEVALALVKESPHFVIETVDARTKRYRLQFSMEQ